MRSYAIGPYVIMAEEGGFSIYEFLKDAISSATDDFLIMGSGLISHLYHGEELVPFSIAVAVRDIVIPVVAKDPKVSWITPIVIASSRDSARRLQRRSGIPHAVLDDIPGKILAAVEDIVGEFVYGVTDDDTFESLIVKPYVFALVGNLKRMYRLFRLPPDRRVYEIYAEKYFPIDFFFSTPPGWYGC